MSNIKNISIPQTCHQSWQQMTTVNDGRHCEHCCKTVVDFTKMSDGEIIQYLSVGNNTCGRFEPQQLNNINYRLYTENLPKAGLWRRAVVFMSMLTPLLFHKANAQTKPVIVNAADTSKRANKNNTDNFTLGKVAVRNSFSITGEIIAKEDGLPIPGAAIKVKGTDAVIFTNSAGKFTINVSGPGNVLVISYIGYDTQSISITDNKPLRIVMQSTSMMLGEVVIVKSVSMPKKAWRKVKDKFGAHSELAVDSNIVRSPYF